MAAPSRTEQALDRLHARVRAHPLLRRFTVCTRILLAIGFIPPSLVKIQGERFTLIPVEHPVGFFFEAMYRTGAYWNFIGWAQLVGALLLLHPRTATLGALVFFPVILNIFVITAAMHFSGTWVVTGLMLLACTYLLCWDYDRLKPLLWAPRAAPAAPRAGALERAAYGMMVAGGGAATLTSRGYVDSAWLLAALGLGALGAAALVVAMVAEARRPVAPGAPAG